MCLNVNLESAARVPALVNFYLYKVSRKKRSLLCVPVYRHNP